MTYEPWDISGAADHCLSVAIEHGWEADHNGPESAIFKKGSRFVLLQLAINGGITRVATDQGAYDGPKRKAWAIKYLETQS